VNLKIAGNLIDVGTLYSLVGLIPDWLEFVKKKLLATSETLALWVGFRAYVSQ
jgi:hypothetical protein